MMMYKKFRNLLFFNLLFITFFTPSLKAIPFIGNIYGGLGGASIDVHESGVIKNNVRDIWSKKNYTNGGINFSLGISSNIHIPIIRNLRLEASYLKSLESGRNNITGLGLYYDIKALPIITPYLGVALLYYNSKVHLFDKKQFTKQRVNQGLTSFNVGVSATLPLFPLGLYFEYRYAIPGVFKNNIRINKEKIDYSNKNYHLSNFILGIRYYFL